MPKDDLPLEHMFETPEETASKKEEYVELSHQEKERLEHENKDTKAKCLIEAALFMSPNAMTLKEIAKIAETPVTKVRVLLNQLIHEYEDRRTSLTIIEENRGFKMGVKPQYEQDVSFLASSPAFHKGVMKTLAYISYKQPVLQSNVINFRNSKAYEHIKLLKEKGFIRKERAGSSYKIYTTKKFHEYFGKSLKKQE